MHKGAIFIFFFRIKSDEGFLGTTNKVQSAVSHCSLDNSSEMETRIISLVSPNFEKGR